MITSPQRGIMQSSLCHKSTRTSLPGHRSTMLQSLICSLHQSSADIRFNHSTDEHFCCVMKLSLSADFLWILAVTFFQAKIFNSKAVCRKVSSGLITFSAWSMYQRTVGAPHLCPTESLGGQIQGWIIDSSRSDSQKSYKKAIFLQKRTFPFLPLEIRASPQHHTSPSKLSVGSGATDTRF